MHHRDFMSKVARLSDGRNRAYVVALGSMLISILLIFLVLMMGERQRIIIVPPDLHESEWVSASSVSGNYIADMTRYFGLLRFNITASSAESQEDALLLHTDPSFYGAFKAVLLSEREALTRHSMSLAFYPVEVNVLNHTSALLTGDLVSLIGSTAIPKQRVTYRLNYRIANSHLLLTAFEEVPHAMH